MGLLQVRRVKAGEPSANAAFVVEGLLGAHEMPSEFVRQDFVTVRQKNAEYSQFAHHPLDLQGE